MRMLRSGAAVHVQHARINGQIVLHASPISPHAPAAACLADSIVTCGGDLHEARDFFARACASSSGAGDAMLQAAFADFLMDVFGDSAAAAAAYQKAAQLVDGKAHVDVLVRLLNGVYGYILGMCVFVGNVEDLWLFAATTASSVGVALS
jgi:hypothetical protein